MTSLVIGCFKFSCKNLPRILSEIETITSPPSTTSEAQTPLVVPQSSSVIVQSCATSHNLLVKYPEFAVLREQYRQDLFSHHESN